MAQPLANSQHFPVSSQVAPETFVVVGRNPKAENGDICGEYYLVASHNSYPVYQHRTAQMTIRFRPGTGRWLMDRGGNRDSDVCVAFADSAPNCNHPACPDMIWHVWESPNGSHVRDEEVVTIAAPLEVRFVGRDLNRNNAVVNGKYIFSKMAYGRPVYQHQTEELILNYYPQEDRWMITHPKDFGTNLCVAWASTGASLHPADGSMQWYFWEAELNNFAVDQLAGVLDGDVPRIVTITGRHPQAENARVNGSYHLQGLWTGMPVYMEPSNGAIIKYSTKLDSWLIDCEVRGKPGLMDKFWAFISSGDADNASNTCTAHAKAHGSRYPHLGLQWSVWETVSRMHRIDANVVAMSAPLVVRVQGRDVRLENSDINGVYQCIQRHESRPVYQKKIASTSRISGTSSLVMYYSKKSRAWVIERNEFSDSGVFVAYAVDASEDPTSNRVSWQVYESSRGGFVPDQAVSIVPHDETEEELPNCDMRDSFVGVEPARDYVHMSRGIKRAHAAGFGGESSYTSLAQTPPQSKQARMAGQGGGGWLRDTSRRIFGA